MPEDSRLFVLLIDGDNIQAPPIPQILDKISAYGDPIIRNVYLNKASLTQPVWDEVSKKYSLNLEYVSHNTSGKNAADIALVIDAMELLCERSEITGFCIVSSDSDFTQLARHIRAKAKTMLGIGERKTPESFRKACSKFVCIEDLLQPQKPIEPPGNMANQEKARPADTGTPSISKTLFIRAYEEAAKGKHKQVPLVTIKEAMVALDPAFQSSAYQDTRRLAAAVKALAKSYPSGVIEITDEKANGKSTTHSIRVDCHVFRLVEAYRHIPEKEKGGWVLLSAIGNELRKHPAYENGFSYHGKQQLSKVVEEMAHHYKKIEIKEKPVGNGKPPIHVVRIKP